MKNKLLAGPAWPSVLPVSQLVLIEGRGRVRGHGASSTVQGVVLRHPLLGRLDPPAGVQAEQAGGDYAQLEEDDGSTGGDDNGQGGADNLSVLVSPAYENYKKI